MLNGGSMEKGQAGPGPCRRLRLSLQVVPGIWSLIEAPSLALLPPPSMEARNLVAPNLGSQTSQTKGSHWRCLEASNLHP